MGNIDYLQALRRGNYLLFLQWLHFLEEKYNWQSEGADRMFAKIQVEFQAAGFVYSDLVHLAIIDALNEESLFVGDFQFSAVTLVSLGFNLFYPDKNYEVVIKKLKQDYAAQIQMARQRLDPLCQVIKAIEVYITYLQGLKGGHDDQVIGVRIEILRSLKFGVAENLSYDDQTRLFIKEKIALLDKTGLDAEEKSKFICPMAQPGWAEQLYQWGVGFFNQFGGIGEEVFATFAAKS